MEVLDYIDLAVHDEKPVYEAVVKYIESNKATLQSLDCIVRVSIVRANKGVRATAEESLARLQQMLRMSKDLPKVWKHDDYVFNFEKMEYKKGKYMLHFTPGEMVMLYQKLVRKQSPNGWGAYFANMKKRHGESFLQGAV